MTFVRSDIIKAAKEFSLEKSEESLQELMHTKFKTSLNPFDDEHKILFDPEEKYEIRKFIRTISDEENGTFDLDELSEKLGLERTGYGKFRFPEYGDLVEKEEAEKLFYQNLLGHLFDGELFANHVKFAKGEYWVNTNFSDFLLFAKLHTLKLSKEIPEDYEYKSFLGLVEGIVGKYDDISEGIRILNDDLKTIESSKNGEFTQKIDQSTKNQINSFTSGIAPTHGSHEGLKVDSVDDIIQKLGFAKDKKDWIWIKASDYLRAQVTEKTEAEKTEAEKIEAEKIEAEKKEIRSNFFYQRLLLSNLVNPKNNSSPIVVSSNFSFNSNLVSESDDESERNLIEFDDDRLKNICLYVIFCKLEEHKKIPLKIFGKLGEHKKIPLKYSKYSSFVKWVNKKIMTKEPLASAASNSDEVETFSMISIVAKIEKELEKELEKEREEAAITIQKFTRAYNAKIRVKEERERLEREERERLKREEKERLEREIAGNQNERITDSSENEWLYDKRSISFQNVLGSHFLIPEITGRDPHPVTQYRWGFPVFNYESLNDFSQDVDAAANKTYEVGMIANEMYETKNNEDNNSLSSIACIYDKKTDKDGNIYWDKKRYCVVTSSSVGVTKNFISETDFNKIVSEASGFYREALYETQVEVADDTKTDSESHSENDDVEKKFFEEMAELYEKKKELEKQIKENEQPPLFAARDESRKYSVSAYAVGNKELKTNHKEGVDKVEVDKVDEVEVDEAVDKKRLIFGFSRNRISFDGVFASSSVKRSKEYIPAEKKGVSTEVFSISPLHSSESLQNNTTSHQKDNGANATLETRIEDKSVEDKKQNDDDNSILETNLVISPLHAYLDKNQKTKEEKEPSGSEQGASENLKKLKEELKKTEIDIKKLWEDIEKSRSSRKDSQTKKTSNQISSAKKSSSSQPLITEEDARLIASKKLSRVMAERVETSIENGRNYRLDSSEVKGIAEDMAEAHKRAVYLYTDEKKEDCIRNVSTLLKSPSPRTSSNGVSFLRPRGNKNIVLVDFNFKEVQEGTPLAGNNEAYVYITGTKHCYVRCQVCKKDNELMTFYKDGKLITERHNRGDVVIDQNTVAFLDEKTGEYTHVNASIYGLREHLNSSGKKNPGIAEAIIGQLKDIQIRATSHIDSATKFEEEPNVERKVAIMHRGISLSYNGDSDKKTIIAKKKIVKKISMIKDDGSIFEIDAKIKFEISDDKVKDKLEANPQYVKMNDILDSNGNPLLTPYLKIEVKDGKVIQGSQLFFIGETSKKMETLRDGNILMKLKMKLKENQSSGNQSNGNQSNGKQSNGKQGEVGDELTEKEEANLIKEAQKIFQHASETIGKNTKLIFPNEENKKRVIGILPTDKEKPSSPPKSCSNLSIFSALNPGSISTNVSSPVSKASSVDKKEKTGVTPSSSCIPLFVRGIIPNLLLGNTGGIR